MSNPRVRGLIVFAVIIFVVVVFCGIIPFAVMPGSGIGVGLPVIEVPGEVLIKDLLPGFNFTNTLAGTLFANFMVLLFVFFAWRGSQGWRKEVPGRFQALAEIVVEGWRSFARGIAGEKLDKAPFLLALTGTIFVFLLAANWMKLFPGVESVGKIHCGHPGQSGYPRVEGAAGGTYLLFVNQPLYTGETATLESEHHCEHYLEGLGRLQAGETPEAAVARYQEEIAHVESELAALESQTTLSAAQREEIDHLHEELHELEIELEIAEARVHAVESVEALEPRVEELTLLEEEGTLTAEQQEALNTAREELRLARTQAYFPFAAFALSDADLETLDNGGDISIDPYIFTITPFFRGPATDLSFTIALALISMIGVQVYGVYAQGPAYFEKFVNLSALGNLRKKPLGAIDFVVGLIEIISEIGKIVSLAFRLFGNLFAGGVVLMIMAFLVAMLLPVIFIGLEIIITTVQALVFAVLTLVFAAQAMESHHGDEHGDEHAH